MKIIRIIIEIIGAIIVFFFLLCLGILIWIWDTITHKKVSKEELEIYQEVANGDYEGHRYR